jgi:transposase-like protein
VTVAAIRFAEDQIIGGLREPGAKMAAICRKHGISTPSRPAAGRPRPSNTASSAMRLADPTAPQLQQES